MAKLKKKKSAPSEDVAVEVKDQARSEKMVDYVKEKREAVRAGTFEFKRNDGSKITTADVHLNEDGLPIVFDADGNTLYPNAPMELFGTTRKGISLRFQYKAAIETARIPALEAKVGKAQLAVANYMAKAEEALVAESPEAKKDRKKARLLAQLAELEEDNSED